MFSRLFKYGIRASVAIIILIAVVFATPPLSVNAQKKNIFVDGAALEPKTVGIVFGAGLVNSSKPSDVLRDRLIVASELFHSGKIKKILVSGDNRTEAYSEPDVMKETLIRDYRVPAEVIYQDFGGRRTYDTCKRAHELFGVNEAILVSQAYHLPRAIWTCKRMGIESKGISATRQPYISDSYYKKREVIAVYKAFVDVYIKAPTVVGGAQIIDLDL